MKKVKWVKIKSPLDKSKLIKMLLENQYDDESGVGFKIKKNRQGYFSGSYFEREVRKIIKLDPRGKEYLEEHIDYYFVNFKWFFLNDLLMVSDPPRSLKKFMLAVSGLVGLGLVIHEYDVNPLKWFDYIKNSIDKPRLVMIDSKNAQISPSANASVCFFGREDIRNDFDDYIGGVSKIISSVKIKTTVDYKDLVVELRMNASVSCNVDLSEDLLDKLQCFFIKDNIL